MGPDCLSLCDDQWWCCGAWPSLEPRWSVSLSHCRCLIGSLISEGLVGPRAPSS
jgi:hypothetical protein